MILVTYWNFYFKNIYNSHNVLEKTPKLSIGDDVFSIEEISFGVKQLINKKSKNIEGYQDEILKFCGPTLIPLTHTLLQFSN